MANVGSADRILRALIGIVLILLPLVTASAAALAGPAGRIWALPAIGAVLLLTAIFRFCPAYRLFGIRTCATR
jgi:hypothetical protein